ncbi:T9SS type A sorting domain-containing protein [Candidatus Latescibacterota bacterium]
MKSIMFRILFLIILFAVNPAFAQDVYERFTVIDVSAGDIQFDDPYREFFALEGFKTGKHDLAISPDGKWIAFIARWGNRFNIWIAPSEGGEASILLAADVDALEGVDVVTDIFFYNPRFSPDGKELLYITPVYDEAKGGDIEKEFDDEGRNTRLGLDNGYRDINALNIETGEFRTVIECAMDFNFSSDGRYICYIRDDYKFNMDETLADHHGVPAIYDTETGETRYLIKDVLSTYSYGGINSTGIKYNSIAMSPDNSYIVVIGRDISTDKLDFYKIPFEGGEFEKFGNVEESGITSSIYDLRFSPDGRYILFNLFNSLSIYDLNTNDIYSPDPEFGSFRTGIWSLSGEEIYYIRSESVDEIVVISFNLDYFDKISGQITAVESETQKSFAVISNYPNPFNPSTTIEFTIPETGFTELVIYNMIGQKIRELVSADMPVGVHSVLWDGRDQNGLAVSSGVFLSRLISGDNVVSSRMMLVK